MNSAAMPDNGGHLVQFFGGDELRLVRNVARFLSDSLRAGGGALVVAAPARREAILDEMREQLGDGFLWDRIVLLDQAETLGRFLVDGLPDATLFDASVGAVARELHERCGSFRAYGEMVGVLWTQGAREAAAALEDLWNDLRRRVGFVLYCGYPVDVLSEDFQIGSVRGVLASHTSVVPARSRSFETAMRCAVDHFFGAAGQGLRSLATATFPSLQTRLPQPERTILRLRSSLPRYADDVIERARLLARDDGENGLNVSSEPRQDFDVEARS